MAKRKTKVPLTRAEGRSLSDAPPVDTPRRQEATTKRRLAGGKGKRPISTAAAPLKRLGVYVEADLIRRLKIAAAERETTMSDLVVKALLKDLGG